METRVLSNLALHGALVMLQNNAEFPANPVIGTMVIKDNVIYAYITLGGMETWYPFASKTNSYIHTQGLESSTWIVNHNLGTTDIWYQIKDPSGNIVLAGMTTIDENTIQIDFTSAIVGTCIVVAPDSIDVPTIKALSINVADGSVVIDNSGILINGSYALTSAIIDNEVTRATNAETTLQANINTEITRATNAEATLNAAILAEVTRTNTLESNLNTEITRASNAESTLSSNILVEKTRALNAEYTLTANLNSEITRAIAAETSLANAISSFGNAFEYVGTVNGGANAGAAYDLSVLSKKSTGDYYKVATSGWFVVGAGDPFYANLNDGLVWNTLNSVDIVDNTNTVINGTTNFIHVVGTTDSGYTINIDDVFKTRMSSVESGLNTEITRASNAESTLSSNILEEKTRALNAEATLSSNLNTEITRATNAEATLTANLNSEITRSTNTDSTLSASILEEKTRAINAEFGITSNLNSEITRASNAEATLTANLNAEISRAQAAEASLASVISSLDGGTY